MSWWNSKSAQQIAVLTNEVNELKANQSSGDIQQRGPFQNFGGGLYDRADENHDVYADFGYPDIVDFFKLYHMYSRKGVAKNAIELPVETGWKIPPEIEANEAFDREFKKLVKKTKFWQRLKGLDTRQRVGRYAGLFMRVKDGKAPSEPIKGRFSSVESLESITPLYESQLRPTTYDKDPKSVRFNMPILYQLSSTEIGGRDEGNTASTPVHWTRIVIAAEGADNGSIFGVPVLEAGYNDLVDLRKINGGGAEGIYKNSAMKVVFDIDGSKNSKLTGGLLETLKEQFDAFIFSPFRKAFVTGGMDIKTLETKLMDPENFNKNSMSDFAASVKIAITILTGNQTGRMASDEDQKSYLNMVQSRRENWQTEMITDVIDWLMLFGLLPIAEYEVVWDDLLAASDEDRLKNADTMSVTNKNNIRVGAVYSVDEIREAAGLDAETFVEPDESLDDDEDTEE